MSDYNRYTEMPMKWHKFLIYFALWLGALGYIVSAFMCFTGTRYGANADFVAQLYRSFGSLKVIDILFGIVNLALAAYAIYTRFQLAGFKPGAPNKLKLLYLFQGIIVLTQPLLTQAILGKEMYVIDWSKLGASLAGTALAIYITRVYYGKRAHLFEDAPAYGTSAYGGSTYDSPATSRVCPNCGAPVQPGDAFCEQCGTKL